MKTSKMTDPVSNEILKAVLAKKVDLQKSINDRIYNFRMQRKKERSDIYYEVERFKRKLIFELTDKQREDKQKLIAQLQDEVNQLNTYIMQAGGSKEQCIKPLSGNPIQFLDFDCIQSLDCVCDRADSVECKNCEFGIYK